MPANLVDLLSEYGFSPVKKTATNGQVPVHSAGGKIGSRFGRTRARDAAITGVASAMRKGMAFNFCVTSRT